MLFDVKSVLILGLYICARSREGDCEKEGAARMSIKAFLLGLVSFLGCD